MTDLSTYLYIYTRNALPISLVLLFVNERVFKSWLKFTVPWLVFSAFAVAIAYDDGGIITGMSLFDQIDMTQYVSSIFTLTSFLIILFGYTWEPLRRRFAFMRNLSRSGLVAALAVFLVLEFSVLLSVFCDGGASCRVWDQSLAVYYLIALALVETHPTALFIVPFVVALIFYFLVAFFTGSGDERAH